MQPLAVRRQTTRISIQIPTKADIINGGPVVAVATEGNSWSKAQLGDYADRSGVYIHHSDGKILYIGKTTSGDYGTFGERLRREFQTKASGNSALHQALASQAKPIRVYLLDLDDIDMMIDSGPIRLTPERKALVLEQTLIGVFEPPENRT